MNDIPSFLAIAYSLRAHIDVMYPVDAKYSLGDKQRRFSIMVSALLAYAYGKGYEVTLGDAARMDNKGHEPNSRHYVRLAIDLNLFLGGEYLTETKDHKQLGRFWEDMGGTWGGRFFPLDDDGYGYDGNHYEFG